MVDDEGVFPWLAADRMTDWNDVEILTPAVQASCILLVHVNNILLGLSLSWMFPTFNRLIQISVKRVRIPFHPILFVFM